MIDLEKLKELALAATLGKWNLYFDWNEPDPVIVIGDVNAWHPHYEDAQSHRPRRDGEFISAANPQAVLELIALVNDLARRLTKSDEKRGKLLALLTSARRCRDKYTLPVYFHDELEGCEDIDA